MVKKKEEKKSLSIKELELKTSVKHSAIWAIALVSMLMMIGVFFGKDGYMVVGVLTLIAGFLTISGIVKG